MRDLKAKKKGAKKQNRRKRQRTPPDWRKIFHNLLRGALVLGSGVLITAGGFLAARLLFASDYFLVEEIRVENLSRLEREELLAFADVKPGVGIFELDLAGIGSKIEENPWVAAARVERHFPRRLVIRVVEREPRAIANLGYLYYVDGGGEIFKVLGPGDRLDYPVITGLGREAMLDDPEAGRRQLRRAVDLLALLKGRRVFDTEQVSEVHLDPEEGMLLFTAEGGVPIRIGFDDYSRKLGYLEQIFAELRPRLEELEYIDLNVPERVIVKLEGASTRGRG